MRRLCRRSWPLTPPPVEVLVACGVAPDAQPVQVVPEARAHATLGVPVVDPVLEASGRTRLSRAVHAVQLLHQAVKGQQHVLPQACLRVALSAKRAHLHRKLRRRRDFWRARRSTARGQE
eukprot:CAMPEP_0119065888 /NCGR_PEP_ID=MMETSP1178-20130426/8597_1 /TAXON_ID=33656 /ORGANISM="unid sp, Strain CCMP2000" /LENGTH=119 /DNA_ID=CAMNT_0007047445 /DNA_START=303 /DNA_END=659 /DNA_ORIENTATION=+